MGSFFFLASRNRETWYRRETKERERERGLKSKEEEKTIKVTRTRVHDSFRKDEREGENSQTRVKEGEMRIDVEPKGG